MDQIEVERINVLTRDTYYQAIHDLHEGLPPPITDDPEELARRDNVAMAEVASMAPANAEEVSLAVLCVTASAHAKDTFRLTRGSGQDAAKNRAQFASLMRQATGARSLLLRVQAARLKREASDNPAADAAAWIEHIGLTYMATALGRPWAGGVAEESGAGTVAQARHSVDADVPRAPLAPARPVQNFETKSRSSGNETDARRTSPPPPVDDAPHILPAGRDASGSETLSIMTHNETPVRHGGAIPPVERAEGQPVRPPLQPWPLPGSEPSVETIVPQHRHPGADQHLRAAAG
jgi:hypothetical protein